MTKRITGKRCLDCGGNEYYLRSSGNHQCIGCKRRRDNESLRRRRQVEREKKFPARETIAQRLMPRDVELGWMENAACVGEDPELFFTFTRGNENGRMAKLICRKCPVSTQCLNTFKREEFGVFGGTDPGQRYSFRFNR